jgi:hypothetical protein
MKSKLFQSKPLLDIFLNLDSALEIPLNSLFKMKSFSEDLNYKHKHEMNLKKL